LTIDAYRVLGKKTIRKDGVAKVTGQEIFASDVSIPGMFHARVLKSPYSHARVKRIDVRNAEKLGAKVITFQEVPKIRFCPRLVSIPEATYKDWQVMSGKPLYVGEAIAAVAARSEKEAQRALEAIEVEYEQLQSSFDPLESMKLGSLPLHESVVLKDEEIPVERNIACQLDIAEGDVNVGFMEADVVIEREYRTNRRYHGQLETKGVVVKPEPDGGISVWSTTQTIHNTRLLLHEIFDIPMGKIRVYKTSLGGSFGSSIQVNAVVPIAVALALKIQRPVRLFMTREEDMHDHCSYQMIFKLKLGSKKDGTLTAGYLETILDIGAHQIQAYPLLGCVVGWWVSLYKLPHKEYHGRAIYTNKVPSCAFRGYGNPQITWAVECLMDELAEKLELDPLDFKLKNYIGEGDLFWGQGPTVKTIVQSCGVEEILKQGADMVNWYNRLKPEDQKGRYRKGLGMGRGFHTSSAGAPLPGTVMDFGGAMLKLNEDGTLDYVTALMDHGGGTLEAHAKIISEELSVPLENIHIVRADTGTTVYDVCTHASRGIYSGGGAALKVARQVKDRLRDYAGRIMDSYPLAFEFRCDDKQKQGVIYIAGTKGKEQLLDIKTGPQLHL
jgi:xanthine dehydrogenase molybdenum-binding subunit